MFLEAGIQYSSVGMGIVWKREELAMVRVGLSSYVSTYLFSTPIIDFAHEPRRRESVVAYCGIGSSYTQGEPANYAGIMLAQKRKPKAKQVIIIT